MKLYVIVTGSSNKLHGIDYKTREGVVVNMLNMFDQDVSYFYQNPSSGTNASIGNFMVGRHKGDLMLFDYMPFVFIQVICKQFCFYVIT